jgi:hypothetical protein
MTNSIQSVGVFDADPRIVNRTRANDDQKTIRLAMKDVLDATTPLEDDPRLFLGPGHFVHQQCRRR